MTTCTLPPLATNGTAPTAVVPACWAPPGETPQAQMTVVSPQMASDWLETAHPNRPISPSRVKKIAQAIAAGLWQLNGATIVLCPEFRLLDGRHRCRAIVQSGLAVPSMVVAGIPPQAFATMDQGGKRTGADILMVEGHPQAAHLASALRWLWRYEHDRMRLSTVEILDYELPGYYARHPELALSLPYGAMTRTLVPQGLGTAFHMLMATKDAALAQRVFEALARGIGLEASDPIYQVREKFLHDRAPLYHASIVERAALLVLGWYCLRKGRPLEAQGLRWKGATEKSVPFPKVV